MYAILGRSSFFFYCLNSAWHGGDQFVALLRWYEAQVSLTVTFSSSACFGLLFLIFLLTILHRFSMVFRSGELAGQSSTPTPWSFNQLLVLLAVWADKISIFEKLVSRRKHEVLQSFLVNGCSDVGFQKTQWTNLDQHNDNPHKAAVLSVGCASFSSTLFPSTQLSVNMLGYSTLWTASFFGNECLCLTLLVKGVNDCLLDNCQISSLPHDCVV